MVFSGFSQEKAIVSLNEINNRSHVNIKIGNLLIPDILLDTGFSFDGLMIYNPDYKDSVDLTNTIEVRLGGAGDGEAQMALMIDSANFHLDNIKMTNQRIIILQSDMYKDFPSNGIIGYSIFGHYVTEFNYDNNTMVLYDRDKMKIDSSWQEIPVYFKNNNIPWIDAQVIIENEKPISISVYIDYAAADAIVLLEKPDMKYSLPKETEDVYIGRGLSGDIYGKSGKISKLIIGKYELNDVVASITSAKVRSKQDNADAILGIGSLRRFNLIFDYFNKKLYLKPNKHL